MIMPLLSQKTEAMTLPTEATPLVLDANDSTVFSEVRTRGQSDGFRSHPASLFASNTFQKGPAFHLLSHILGSYDTTNSCKLR